MMSLFKSTKWCPQKTTLHSHLCLTHLLIVHASASASRLSASFCCPPISGFTPAGKIITCEGELVVSEGNMFILRAGRQDKYTRKTTTEQLQDESRSWLNQGWTALSSWCRQSEISTYIFDTQAIFGDLSHGYCILFFWQVALSLELGLIFYVDGRGEPATSLACISLKRTLLQEYTLYYRNSQ